MILEYIENPNVAVIYFFADTGHPYTCNFWGEHGIYPEFPILVEGKSHGIHEWFNIEWQSPRHIFLDQNFNYHAITNDKSEVHDIIEGMLENLE